MESRADRYRVHYGDAPPLGAHMVTPRRGYLHHGIYVGGGNVVHYAGLSYGLRKGPVEEIPLNRFRGFRPVWVKPDPTARFQGSRVVERARSRLGENRYHLLTNNCEHFCEWCLYGEQRSYQVEELLAWYRRAIGAAIDAGRQLASLVPITRSVQRPERQYMRLVGQRLHSPSSPQGSN